MFKTAHMVITIVKTIKVAKILLDDYNINIKTSDMKATELVFMMAKARTMSNKQIAKEVYETMMIQDGLFGKVEAA